MTDDNNGSEEQQQDGWTDERRPAQPDRDHGDDEQQHGADTGDDEQPDRDHEDDDGETEQPGKGNAEAAKYRRQRNEARQLAEDYGRRLFTELVRSSGKLTDATDMPYSEELLENPEELAAAIDDLIEQKPHLKARQFQNIGQHGRAERPGVSLADILRNNA